MSTDDTHSPCQKESSERNLLPGHLIAERFVATHIGLFGKDSVSTVDHPERAGRIDADAARVAC